MATSTSASPFENDSVSRNDYVGGSEAFELLSQKQYGRGCARALAYRKLQTPEDVPMASARDRALSMRAILNRGHLLEDLVARLYMDRTGRAVIRRQRLVRNPDHPGAGVHTDRIVLAHRIVENGELTDQTRPTGDAEIKTHAEGPFYNILRSGLPAGHNLQLQWSLFCTGHLWGAFIIMGVFGELPLKHFDVERDPELMNIFAYEIDRFWNTLKAGDLPAQLPDASDVRCKVCPFRLTCRGEALEPAEYRRLLDEHEGKRALTPVNNDELDQALADRALIMSEIEALSSEDDEEPGALQLVTRRIKELLGDTEAATVNGHWKVYCSENSWSGLDTQRLKAEHPEIYKQYFIDKRATGTKRLKVYALNGRVA
jgi:predicted phage-related endonuclease